MAVSHLRNTPITGKSYTTPVDATRSSGISYSSLWCFGLVAGGMHHGGMEARDSQRCGTEEHRLRRHVSLLVALLQAGTTTCMMIVFAVSSMCDRLALRLTLAIAPVELHWRVGTRE